MANLIVGDKVQVLVDSPTGEAIEATVAVIQDVPGKQVGVVFSKSVANGHDLDGETTQVVDPETGRRYGKGWYSRPENLEIIE